MGKKQCHGNIEHRVNRAGFVIGGGYGTVEMHEVWRLDALGGFYVSVLKQLMMEWYGW